MTLPLEENNDDELGIEYFDDVYNARSKPQRDVPKEISRHVGRTGARIGETILGLPGDISNVGTAAASWLGGWLGDKARSLLGKEPLTAEQKDNIKEETRSGDWDLLAQLTESLPTSTSLKENVTRKYTGNYLEPQNDFERFSDEVASDFASLLIPVKGKIPFARALGQSVLANAGGELSGAFFGEDAKNYTKIGLLFASGLIGQKGGGVKKYINNLYDDMRSEIQPGATVSASSLEKQLNNIESSLMKGDPTAASKQPVFQKIKAIRNKISGGEIAVDELIELTKDTNEVIFSGKDIVRKGNKIYDVRESLQKSTQQYGSQNASFLDKWKDANQAYAATEASRKVGNWVKQNIKPKDYAYAAGALGLEGLAIGAPAALGTVGAGAALAGTAYTAEILKRISQSSALRTYYTNVINNALKQNKASFVRSMKQLDKGIEKSFEKEPYETIEFND